MSSGIYRIIGHEVLTGLTFIFGLWFTAIFNVNSRIYMGVYEFLLIFEIFPGSDYYLLITFVVVCSLIIMGLIMMRTGGFKGIIAMFIALLSSWLFVSNIWVSASAFILALIVAGYSVRHRLNEGVLGNILVIKIVFPV